MRWRRSPMRGTLPPMRPTSTASHTAISHQLYQPTSRHATVTTESACAGLDLALAAPHRLPQQEKTRECASRNARGHQSLDAPRDRSVQREQHQPERQLRVCHREAFGRGQRAGAHRRVRHVMRQAPRGLSLYSRDRTATGLDDKPDRDHRALHRARSGAHASSAPHLACIAARCSRRASSSARSRSPKAAASRPRSMPPRCASPPCSSPRSTRSPASRASSRTRGSTSCSRSICRARIISSASSRASLVIARGARGRRGVPLFALAGWQRVAQWTRRSRSSSRSWSRSAFLRVTFNQLMPAASVVMAFYLLRARAHRDAAHRRESDRGRRRAFSHRS